MHKEQIMIDGVDVLKEKINICFILLLNKLETPETIEQTIYEHLETFVKEWNTQLARKTQECEDLKKQLMRKDEINTFFNSPIEGWSSDPCGICKYKDEYSRYRKALEEIEEAIATYSSKHQYSIANDLYNQILDIINKAKEESL